MTSKATHEADAARPRVGPGATAIAVVVGFFVLIFSWTLLHIGFFEAEFPDTQVYERYSDRMLDGLVPYRDFSVPYPPTAIPVFLLPAVGPADHYRDIFEFLMLLCAEAAIGFAAFMLRSADATLLRIYAAVIFMALAPLALGSVVLGRYDLWPAALTSAAVAALVAGRGHLGAGLLAVSAGAKLYAVAIVPVALLYIARRRGRRAAAVALGVFLATSAIILLPFAFGSGTLDQTAQGQTINRPLQLESLGASVLLAAHQLGIYTVNVVQVPGSQGPGGSLPDALANVAEVLQVLSVLLITVLFWRGPMTRARLLTACAASVVGFLVFGKMLSANYLVWLIPLVPLVAGQIGLAAMGLFGSALVLTQVWFPRRHFDVVFLEDITWVVLVRNLVLVALFVVLVLGLRTSKPARAP